MVWDVCSGELLLLLIVWQDNCIILYIECLCVSGVEVLVLECSGLLFDVYFLVSKLGWIVEYFLVVCRVLKVGCLCLGISDVWFFDCLCGIFVIDVIIVLCIVLMNFVEGCWDFDLCVLFGVLIECLLEICDIVGYFGVIGNILLMVLVVDQQVLFYGYGCCQFGDVKIIFGIGVFVLIFSGEWIICLLEIGLFVIIVWQIDGKLVYVMDGGVYDVSVVVEWVGCFGLFSDFLELVGFDWLLVIECGLVFVLVLLGFVCLYWDCSVGVMWLGMDVGICCEDFCQVLFEGVVLCSVEVIQVMDGYLKVIDCLFIDGGLVCSFYFVQFFVDSL